MRTVEVPIVWSMVRGREWDRILELGNVMGHYMRIGWPVLDLRERGKGVVNADLMTWAPRRPYDLIVSISTLEHVGYGRYEQSGTTSPAEALARIRGWLAPGGVALLTVPLGYNLVLDAQLAAGELPADEVHCMRRVSEENEWAECTLAEALAAERPAGYRWSVAMAALICRMEGCVKTLNLGAGKRPIKGATNHDRRLDPTRPWITVGHDLNVLPWPWADESYDRIVARAVFEHLEIDMLASLNECWRILRPGGLVYVKVAYWDSEIAHEDPTHRWFLAPKAFDLFDPARRRGKEYDFYSERTWRITKGPKLNDARSSIHVTMVKRATKAAGRRNE
jgi:SAM-dependent methyltransferase